MFVIRRYNSVTCITTVEHFLNMVRHCDDGPAVKKYNQDGVLISQVWYHHGLLHRKDGPAWIYYDTPTQTYDSYFINNKQLTYKKFKLYHESERAKIFIKYMLLNTNSNLVDLNLIDVIASFIYS